MEIVLKLKIGNKEMELTRNEANELYNILHKLFGTNPLSIPYPIEPISCYPTYPNPYGPITYRDNSATPKRINFEPDTCKCEAGK